MVHKGTCSSYRLVDWSTVSGFDLAWFSCLLSASVSSIFMVLYIYIYIYQYIYLKKFSLTSFSSPFIFISRWDWLLTWLTDHCSSVLWHCWLDQLTHKVVSEWPIMCRVGHYYTIPYCNGTSPIKLCLCMNIATASSDVWASSTCCSYVKCCHARI